MFIVYVVYVAVGCGDVITQSGVTGVGAVVFGDVVGVVGVVGAVGAVGIVGCGWLSLVLIL